MNIVLLGAPGSGKGTHAQRLSTNLNWPHISTGDILRQHLADSTALGNKAKQFMDSGQLVPDTLIIELMEDRLAKSDCQQGFILDGFPRTIAQAEALDKLLQQQQKNIDKVIALTVPLAVIISRMAGRLSCKQCGAVYHRDNLPPKVEGVCDRCGQPLSTRSDDQPDTVKARYHVYEEQTAPLIAYYEKQEKVLSVNSAEGTVESIYERIVKLLGV